MTEENDNQIQLRSAGGIGQHSDLARRGMNAANYVTGLTARQGVDIQPTSTEYTYEFLRKWGTPGAAEGFDKILDKQRDVGEINRTSSAQT